MRRLRRVIGRLPLQGCSLAALLLGLSLTACSLPDIYLEKHKHSFSTPTTTPFSAIGSKPAPDKRILATVHVRFSEEKQIPALSFDIRKDKRSVIAAKLFESEQTITTVHFGYTRSDGPIAGFHFNWRF